MRIQIENYLQNLLYDVIYDNISSKVEQFDYSYLDMIDFILMEKFGKNIGIEKFNEFKSLIKMQFSSKKEILEKLKEIGINNKDYAPRISNDKFKEEQEYKKPLAWNEAEGVVVNDNQVHKINNLQKEYSIQSKGYIDKKFLDLARPETGDVWTKFIGDLLKNNLIDNTGLAIGCRWAGEVLYFREIGIKNMIGLDLFSRYKDLVFVGDMHQMEFVDNSFSFIYQRNTFNKSYDIRKTLQECLRVLKPGGVLIYDDVQDYTCGVNELARTNIISNKWILSFLKIDDNIEEIFYDQQTKCNEKWCNSIGQLAVKIKK